MDEVLADKSRRDTSVNLCGDELSRICGAREVQRAIEKV
jgi:hypothetical protein